MKNNSERCQNCGHVFDDERKTQLYRINRIASEWFQKKAHECSDASVLEAVDGSINIGYAPANWCDFRDYCTQEDISLEDAKDAGLLTKEIRGIRYYDRFRDRLMIPIEDAEGNIVGFCGKDHTSVPYFFGFIKGFYATKREKEKLVSQWEKHGVMTTRT